MRRIIRRIIFGFSSCKLIAILELFVVNPPSMNDKTEKLTFFSSKIQIPYY